MSKPGFYETRFVIVRTEPGADKAFSVRDNKEGCWIEQGANFEDTFTREEAQKVKADCEKRARIA